MRTSSYSSAQIKTDANPETYLDQHHSFWSMAQASVQEISVLGDDNEAQEVEDGEAENPYTAEDADVSVDLERLPGGLPVEESAFVMMLLWRNQKPDQVCAAFRARFPDILRTDSSFKGIFTRIKKRKAVVEVLLDEAKKYPWYHSDPTREAKAWRKYEARQRRDLVKQRMRLDSS